MSADRKLGMAKTVLAYQMLSTGKFAEASDMFLSALQEQDIQHMVESVSDNSSVKFESVSGDGTDGTDGIGGVDSSKPLSLAQIVHNNSIRDIKINPRQDTHDRYDSFDHLPGDDFYQDLLEDDSLTNRPILATLSCDPSLPDVVQVYSSDELFEGFEDNDKSFEKDLISTQDEISSIDWNLENLGGKSFKHKKAEEELKKEVVAVDETEDNDNVDDEADAAFNAMGDIG